MARFNRLFRQITLESRQQSAPTRIFTHETIHYPFREHSLIGLALSIDSTLTKIFAFSLRRKSQSRTKLLHIHDNKTHGRRIPFECVVISNRSVISHRKEIHQIDAWKRNFLCWRQLPRREERRKNLNLRESLILIWIKAMKAIEFYVKSPSKDSSLNASFNSIMRHQNNNFMQQFGIGFGDSPLLSFSVNWRSPWKAS